MRAATLALTLCLSANAGSLRGSSSSGSSSSKAPTASSGHRVNEVYYQNAAGNMGEGDIEPGTDFDELRAVGVNTLSVGFYNPERLMDAEYVSYGNSSFNDDAGLAGLAKNWQGALGEEWGMFLVSIGGMTAKKEDFESAFADGAKLGAAYGKVLASLREKSGAKSMQIGLDIDVEGPCDKDKQCGQAVRNQLGPFLKALRANGCPHDSCPVQLDATLTFYFISKEAGRRWSLDAVLENGPTGNAETGINYVSMMVNNVATTGIMEKGYLNGETGSNTELLNKIAPPETRIVNFWGSSDGKMTTEHVKLFVEDPGLGDLFSWMKQKQMGVAWFSWEATQKNGGSDKAYGNMKAVQAAVFG